MLAGHPPAEMHAEAHEVADACIEHPEQLLEALPALVEFAHG